MVTHSDSGLHRVRPGDVRNVAVRSQLAVKELRVTGVRIPQWTLIIIKVTKCLKVNIALKISEYSAYLL